MSTWTDRTAVSHSTDVVMDTWGPLTLLWEPRPVLEILYSKNYKRIYNYYNELNLTALSDSFVW